MVFMIESHIDNLHDLSFSFYLGVGSSDSLGTCDGLSSVYHFDSWYTDVPALEGYQSPGEFLLRAGHEYRDTTTSQSSDYKSV